MGRLYQHQHSEYSNSQSPTIIMKIQTAILTVFSLLLVFTLSDKTSQDSDKKNDMDEDYEDFEYDEDEEEGHFEGFHEDDGQTDEDDDLDDPLSSKSSFRLTINNDKV